MKRVLSVMSWWRGVGAGALATAVIGAGLVAGAPPAGAATGMLSIGNAGGPADIADVGAFAVTGTLTNGDAVNPAPTVHLAARLDGTSAATPVGPTALTAAMLHGSCDVGGSSSTVTVDGSGGVVTATCPAPVTLGAAEAQDFTFHLGLSASGDAGVIQVSLVAVNASDSSTEASQAAPDMTLHSPAAFTVNAPASVGSSPTTFDASLDNTGGAPLPAPYTARLDVTATDGGSGNLNGVTPSQITLTCDRSGDGGTDSGTVTFGGGANVGGGLTGTCDSVNGFPLAAGDKDAWSFGLSFDPAVPSGTLTLTFAVVVTDGNGTWYTPALVSQVANVSVFPPPTLSTSPPTPAVVATGAPLKGYAGQLVNPTAGRSYNNVRLGLQFGALGGLASTDIHVSCDGGSTFPQLFGAISSGGSGVVAGKCALPSGNALPADTTATPAPTISFCLDSGAPTGTLSVTASLLDADNSDAVLASDAVRTFTVVSGPSQVPDCRAAGRTLVWTGAANDGLWGTASNWDGSASPGAGDTAVVPAGASISNVGGQVSSLVLDGGSTDGAAALLTLSSNLEVLNDTTLSGHVGVSGGGAEALVTDAGFTTAGGTDVRLGDASDLTIPATAVAGLGSGTVIRRFDGATGAVPVLHVAGTLRPTGSATLGVPLDVTGKLDTNSATLNIASGSASHLRDGAAIITSTTNGVFAVASGGVVAVDGAVSVGSGATLQLGTGGALIGTASGSVVDTTAGGTGNFDWEGGQIAGTLTLGPNLSTRSVNASDQSIANGATLTNRGSMSLQGTSAPYDLEGTLDNVGSLSLRPGATLLRTGSTSAAGLVNHDTGSLTLEPGSGGVTSSAAVTLTGVPLSNSSNFTLPSGESMRVRGASVDLTGGSLLGGGTASSSSSSSSTSTTPAPGTLAVGAGGDLRLHGTVVLAQGAVLALDDASTASDPTLEADSGSALTSPSSATAVSGAFHWCDGHIMSSLSVGKLVTTEIGTGAVSGSCLAGSNVAVGVGPGADSSHRTVVSFGGTAAINNATLTLDVHSQVSVAGASTLGGGVVLDHSGSDVNDESFVIGSAGALSMPSLQLPTLFSTTHPTINVSLVNNGSFTADSALALHAPFTNIGSASIAAAVTAGAPIVNSGNLTIFQSTLDARSGYTQQTASDAGPNTSAPITQLNDTKSVLTTSDGGSPATLAPVAINSGGIVGGGTVTASAVTIGAGFVRPSPFNNGAATTLTIAAPLQLSSTSDVQVIVNQASHDVLKVQGAATIAGRITGFTGTGYTPTYLTRITGVMTFPSHSGDFTASSWGGTPTGLGWKPEPLTAAATQVNLHLVDVAPPSLGIASISAFTEFVSQRVTYAAVDNRTGVKSYDVRWRKANPQHAPSAWHYPKTWQRATATSESLGGLVPGWEYCFSVRSRDVAGNTTPWSIPLCTTRLLDDMTLVAHGSWQRPTKKAGFYLKTYSQTKRLGAYLAAASGTFTRVAVVAYRCRTCGTIGIYAGKTLLKKWNLRSATPRLGNWISPILASRRAVITIRSLTKRKTVVIDAVGIAR